MGGHTPTDDVGGNKLTPCTCSTSGTNVQVAGVDESDIAKTDGTFIYTISKSSGALFIVRAHPASASQGTPNCAPPPQPHNTH